MASTPPRLRSKKGDPARFRETDDDPEAIRRRRSTANRILTILKSALNYGRAEGTVTGSDDAWRLVKPFKEADQPKVRYLLDDEITRLINACPPDFRELVIGALMTGARYGELAAMRALDFDPRSGTVSIGRSKNGKPRHVALTDEGRRFFSRMAAGKAAAARLFERDKVVRQETRDAPVETIRADWGNADQFRPIRAACLAANIAPDVSFHELRHTYASRLAMRGVSMNVIAAQLGHRDTRMTERHYAHLSPSYVAETVRRSFGSLGIVSETVVTPIRRPVGL
jgi:integrase